MIASERNIKIRPAGAADGSAVADIFAQSWRHAYTGLIPHVELTRCIARRDRGWWEATLSGGGHLLLEVVGQPAGYAGLGLARRSGPPEGEIYELYLAPLYQGLGFGEHLFEACRSRLDARGLSGLIVWVLRDNLPARGFYIRRGGHLMYRRVDVSTGAPLEKVAYVWQ